MKKLSAKGLLIIALILSVATSMLVYNYLKGLSARTARQGLPVVVAKADIPPRTRVTADMVQEVLVPAEYIQPGAVAESAKVVGVIVREQIVAGEQVTGRRLMGENRATGLTAAIPPDKRAVTVAITEVTGVAGFVKPGDAVDVIATFDQNAVGENASRMILQNIQVLAANRETEQGVAEDKEKKDVLKTTTVTLAVSPEEAAKLTVAEEKGKIRLALRPYLPNGVQAAQAVTPKDLMGTYVPPTQPRTQAPVRESGGSGIMVIRGTKAETVPVH